MSEQTLVDFHVHATVRVSYNGKLTKKEVKDDTTWIEAALEKAAEHAAANHNVFLNIIDIGNVVYMVHQDEDGNEEEVTDV